MIMSEDFFLNYCHKTLHKNAYNTLHKNVVFCFLYKTNNCIDKIVVLFIYLFIKENPAITDESMGLLNNRCRSELAGDASTGRKHRFFYEIEK